MALTLRAGHTLYLRKLRGTHFCWVLSQPQGPVRLEGLFSPIEGKAVVRLSAGRLGL
jgi:hypothetical protein